MKVNLICCIVTFLIIELFSQIEVTSKNDAEKNGQDSDQQNYEENCKKTNKVVEKEDLFITVAPTAAFSAGGRAKKLLTIKDEDTVVANKKGFAGGLKLDTRSVH